MSNPSPIVVVGAGVIGLSTATLLQQRYPVCSITVIAAELPTFRNNPQTSADYASMWAGAHYRPIPASSPQLVQEDKFAKRSFEVMKRIAHDNPSAGVQLCKGVEHLEQPPNENLRLRTGDVYSGPGDGFRVLGPAELPQDVKWGCEYDTYVVNVHVYCQWLLDEFIRKGGKVLRKRLQNAQEVFNLAGSLGLEKLNVVVNCSGRNFDLDPKSGIIRGQTVLVRQQYDKTITRQNNDGSWTFLIPRPLGGGTIVGGTKEVGDWEADIRIDTRTLLLKNAATAFPSFVGRAEDFDILGDNVGRRPWREGGMRIEIEPVDKTRNIVHGYGAGGRGYELSWGAAEQIVGMVDALIAPRARI